MASTRALLPAGRCDLRVSPFSARAPKKAFPVVILFWPVKLQDPVFVTGQKLKLPLRVALAQSCNGTPTAADRLFTRALERKVTVAWVCAAMPPAAAEPVPSEAFNVIVQNCRFRSPPPVSTKIPPPAVEAVFELIVLF